MLFVLPIVSTWRHSGIYLFSVLNDIENVALKNHSNKNVYTKSKKGLTGKTFTENWYQTKSGLALCQREVGIKRKQVPVVKKIKGQPQNAIATVIILIVLRISL